MGRNCYELVYNRMCVCSSFEILRIRMTIIYLSIMYVCVLILHRLQNRLRA
jgi:hypothetical protein